MGAAIFHLSAGKFLVAVDDDIDPWDTNKEERNGKSHEAHARHVEQNFSL